MRKKKKENVSFTLIELLVVIAIIAILAAMLLPALSNARAAGQTAGCKTNIKNIGSFIHMYIDSYNGYIPAIYDGRRGTNIKWVWPFLDSLNIGLKKSNYKYNGCSVQRPFIQAKIEEKTYDGQYDWALYGYNGYLGYHDGNGNVGTSWSQNYAMGILSKVKNPSQKMLAADTNYNMTIAALRYYVNYKEDSIGYVHNGTVNMVFIDGHVENHKHTDFERIPSAAELKTHHVTDKYLKPDKI